MGIVQAQANMSLDGYVGKQDNTIGRLFDWLQNGEVAIPTPAGDFTVHLTPASAEHWRRWVPSLGALVCGRTLFDVTDGWQGRHTLDVPVVVVTHHVPTDWIDAHPEAPFSFVTTGVEAAISRAQEFAGERVVAVTGGTIARQCLELGSWTRWPSTWCRWSWARATGPSSASSRPRMSCSATRRSASRATGSLTSCSRWCSETGRTVWVQRTGPRPVAQRDLATGVS